jgi:hypothetical protein
MNQQFRAALLNMAQDESMPRQLVQAPEGMFFMTENDDFQPDNGQDPMLMIPVSDVFILINILWGQLLAENSTALITMTST